MSDSNNFNLTMPGSINSTLAVFLIVGCQFIDSISDIIKELIKSDRKDSSQHNKTLSSKDCYASFQKAVDQLLFNPEASAVLQYSKNGCKLIVSRNQQVTVQAAVPN